MKKMLALVTTLSLSACGSFTTVTKNDQIISANLNKRNTNCESLPRIYGGLSYDFCSLHSNPGGMYFDWLLGFYVVDAFVSTAADTVLLPYTGYVQYKDGNIDIDERRTNPQ